MSLTDTVKSQLERDEGVILHYYQDSRGYASVGCGRCIDQRVGGGLSQDEVDYLLANDISRAVNDATLLVSNFNDLTEARQAAIVGMVFNLGKKGFSTFTTFIRYITSEDYENAALDLLGTAAARELPARYQRYANAIRIG